MQEWYVICCHKTTLDIEAMPLHHRIWELVKMISNPPGQDAQPVNKAPSGSPSRETVFGSVESEETVARGDRTRREEEISRLTWLVLDGNASVMQRQRLAELVSAQHENRRA